MMDKIIYVIVEYILWFFKALFVIFGNVLLWSYERLLLLWKYDQPTESIEPIHEKVVDLRPPSLTNMGATCYLNSAFQGISACDTFVKEMHDLADWDKNEEVKKLQTFKDLIDILNGCSKNKMEISRNKIFCKWNKCGQQDSYEVLIYTLNQVYNQLRKFKENQGLIPKRDLEVWLKEILPMRLIIQYTIICGCNMITKCPLQSDLAFHVTIPRNMHISDLNELLDLYFGTDPIQDYQCEKEGCDGKDTKRVARLCKPLPHTVCVHLQRTFWNGFEMKKINNTVIFGMKLIIKPRYWKVENMPQNNKAESKEENTKENIVEDEDKVVNFVSKSEERSENERFINEIMLSKELKLDKAKEINETRLNDPSIIFNKTILENVLLKEEKDIKEGDIKQEINIMNIEGDKTGDDNIESFINDYVYKDLPQVENMPENNKAESKEEKTKEDIVEDEDKVVNIVSKSEDSISYNKGKKEKAEQEISGCQDDLYKAEDVEEYNVQQFVLEREDDNDYETTNPKLIIEENEKEMNVDDYVYKFIYERQINCDGNESLTSLDSSIEQFNQEKISTIPEERDNVLDHDIKDIIIKGECGNEDEELLNPMLSKVEQKIETNSESSEEKFIVEETNYKIKIDEELNNIPNFRNDPEKMDINKNIIINDEYRNDDEINESIKTNHQKVENEKESVYDLVSVIEHSGTVYGGHYICYKKVNNKWFLTNDSWIQEVSEQCVLNCQAYVLFYEQPYGQSTSNESSG